LECFQAIGRTEELIKDLKKCRSLSSKGEGLKSTEREEEKKGNAKPKVKI